MSLPSCQSRELARGRLQQEEWQDKALAAARATAVPHMLVMRIHENLPPTNPLWKVRAAAEVPVFCHRARSLQLRVAIRNLKAAVTRDTLCEFDATSTK